MNKEQLLRNYCNDYIANKITFDEFQSLFSEINHSEISIEGQKHKMPPESFIFKISNTENYPIFFPIEMRNKHYIVDLMDILREGLLLFIQKIRRKCSRLEEPEGEDVYYLLKWLKNNVKIWHPVVLPGLVEGPIVNQIFNLLNLRNSFSHQNDTMTNNRRGALKTVSTSNVDQCFQDCMNLLSTIGIILGHGKTEFIQENMIALDKQRRLHQLYKKKRNQFLKRDSSMQQPQTESSPNQTNVKPPVNCQTESSPNQYNVKPPVNCQTESSPNQYNVKPPVNCPTRKLTPVQTNPNGEAHPIAPIKNPFSNLSMEETRIKLIEYSVRSLASAPFRNERLPPAPLTENYPNKKAIKDYLKNNLRLRCSTSDTFKPYMESIYFANQNLQLEFRTKNRWELSGHSISIEDSPVRSIRIRDHKIYILNEKSVLIYDMVKLLEYFSRGNSFPLIENFADIKINLTCKNNLFAISTDNDFIFVVARSGNRKNNIYWYRISTGTLLKNIFIFMMGKINIIFFRIIGNRQIIADEKTIYIAEFNKEMNFNILFKINRFSTDSLLTITNTGKLIELIKNTGCAGRVDIWDIRDFKFLHSIPILAKEKVDGFFIATNEQELYMWFCLNNNLYISKYNFIENSEIYIFQGLIIPGHIIEDLFVNSVEKIIIYRSKFNNQLQIGTIKY